ncbi:MAG: hypothetical protein JSV49_01090, partial [Thermoplasmata archaeon]
FPKRPEEGEPHLKMVYRLSFVPAGIMSWFIVRTHQYSTNKQWREGVFLHYMGHHAKVELRKSAHRIFMEVWGPHPQNFFVILMNSMDLILHRFPGLTIKRNVPCICKKGDPSGEDCHRYFPYSDLVRRFATGKMYVECPDSFENVSVQAMLYGIHPSTQDQILEEVKGLRREEAADYQQMTELLNRYFSRTYNLILDEKYHCPNVFLIKPKDLKKWNPNRLFSERYNIQLYCQSPSDWHATDWIRELKKPKKWWLEFSPWLSKLIELMKFAIPVISVIPSERISRQKLKEFEKNLDIMSEFAGVNLERKPSEDTDQVSSERRVAATQTVDFALRQLYFLLDELDPSHEWGGLSPVLTPEGTLLWLCPEHKKEYLVPTLEI